MISPELVRYSKHLNYKYSQVEPSDYRSSSAATTGQRHMTGNVCNSTLQWRCKVTNLMYLFWLFWTNQERPNLCIIAPLWRKAELLFVCEAKPNGNVPHRILSSSSNNARATAPRTSSLWIAGRTKHQRWTTLAFTSELPMVPRQSSHAEHSAPNPPAVVAWGNVNDRWRKVSWPTCKCPWCHSIL